MAIRIKKYFVIAKNFCWNLLAAMLSTGVQQLIVYPWLAKRYSDEEYGNILLIIGIVNVIILTLGNSLGDVRLILNSKLSKNNDYNLILFGVIGIVIALGI